MKSKTELAKNMCSTRKSEITVESKPSGLVSSQRFCDLFKAIGVEIVASGGGVG